MHTPIRTRTISERKFQWKPWITPGILKSGSKQKKMYKSSICKTGKATDIAKYKEYRTVLNKVKRQAKLHTTTTCAWNSSQTQ